MKKVFVIFILILAVLVSGGLYIFHSRGSSETSQKYKGFNFIYEDKDINKDDFDKIDGQYYLSYDFIKENIDENIDYSKKDKTVVIVNSVGTKRIELNKNTAIVNTKEISLRDSVIEKDGKIMLPIEIFIYDYPVSLRYINEKNLLVMDKNNVEYAVGISTGNGLNMREKASIKSPIVSILKDKEQVYVYGEKGDFYKVRQMDGYAGYIKKSLLDVKFPKNRFKIEKSEEKREARKPLNLTWDYTYGPQSEESINTISKIEGLNVICPTWFSIKDTDCNIIDRGSQEYVNKYKNLGIEVWAYLDNSFDSDLTASVLSTSTSRHKIIIKTLNLIEKYGLSGINIDFENTRLDDRENISRFVKEIYGVLNQRGIKVSVDVTPQISSDVTKELYDRKKISEFSDYVMLMAYDQHWASSQKAGSVAEYSWVEGNINLLFRQIPKEKLILGVPFYARLWTEKEDNVNSNSLSMTQVSNLLNSKGVIPKWDEKIKQYYAEYSENNKMHKIWIEDATSIAYKASLINKYDLGGIASWRKGFETSDVWTKIANVIY